MIHMLTSKELEKLKEFIEHLDIPELEGKDKLKFIESEKPELLKSLIKDVTQYLNR